MRDMYEKGASMWKLLFEEFQERQCNQIVWDMDRNTTR
jgi:hypothetical protein